MAVVTKIRRLANPTRSRAKRRNPRRKLTAKQIKFFGTARQKAGLKAARKRKRVANHRPRRKANPPARVKRTRIVRKKKSTRKRVNNPALVLTLGAVNPQRRKSTMARKARRVKARKTNSSRRRRVVVSAPKHRKRTRKMSNPRRYSTKRKRNPTMFGQAEGGLGTVKMVAAGIGGMAVCKFVPTVLPSQFVSSPILRVVSTGAAAFLASFVAKKAGMSERLASAVLFGGLIQTGSVALNAFLPASITTRLALSGLGDFVPGSFPVPQNPLRIQAPIATNARTTVNGLERSMGRSI